MHTQRQTVRIFFAFPLFGSKSLWLHYIFSAHINSCGHISSNQLLTHYMWTYLLLRATHANSHGYTFDLPSTQCMFPSCMPPMQFTRHFLPKYPCPVYFRNQVHFLFFLPVSEFFSNMPPTQLMWQRDLQGNIQQNFKNTKMNYVHWCFEKPDFCNEKERRV